MEYQRLSDLRKEKGISQKELAEILNISSGCVAMYETGKRNPPLKNAIAIAKFFNVPLEKISFSNKTPVNECCFKAN